MAAHWRYNHIVAFNSTPSPPNSISSLLVMHHKETQDQTGKLSRYIKRMHAVSYNLLMSAQISLTRSLTIFPWYGHPFLFSMIHVKQFISQSINQYLIPDTCCSYLFTERQILSEKCITLLVTGRRPLLTLNQVLS